jgi:hypothetical protein
MRLVQLHPSILLCLHALELLLQALVPLLKFDHAALVFFAALCNVLCRLEEAQVGRRHLDAINLRLFVTAVLIGLFVAVLSGLFVAVLIGLFSAVLIGLVTAVLIGLFVTAVLIGLFVTAVLIGLFVTAVLNGLFVTAVLIGLCTAVLNGLVDCLGNNRIVLFLAVHPIMGHV